MRTVIRYMATTDESRAGIVALEYLKSLLRVAPVKLCSMSGGLGGAWSYYAPLMSVPQGPYVNVVCCVPARWAWNQPITMPNVDANGRVVSVDTDAGVVELYTAGVRNVLLATAGCSTALQVMTAHRYEVIAVPTPELRDIWRQPTNLLPVMSTTDRYFDPVVIPVPVTDHDAIRTLVMS